MSLGEPFGDGIADPQLARELEAADRADLDRIPTVGHAALFFVLAAVLLAGGQMLALVGAQKLHLFGTQGLHGYMEMAGSDARLGVPVQAFAYLLLLLGAGVLFRWMWHLPPLQGLHWRAPAAARRAGWLIALGLFCGVANSVAGNFLPMPKDPPIMADMMRSPLGAWEMLLFGVTLAPLVEEVAFRGFLLAGLVHAWGRWERRGRIDRKVRILVGLPISVLLTTAPFALLHGAQVSHAWAPLLLIGVVSVVLCVVRLLLDSVAASTLVHASYNLTLFLGILAETGGFRHMDRLQ